MWVYMLYDVYHKSLKVTFRNEAIFVERGS